MAKKKEQGCLHCHATTDARGRRHHQPNCPEMSFPSGVRRDAPGDYRPRPEIIKLEDELREIFHPEPG